MRRYRHLSISFSCSNILLHGVDAFLEKCYCLQIASVSCLKTKEESFVFFFQVLPYQNRIVISAKDIQIAIEESI